MALGIERGEIDFALIADGNAAAHKGNAVADAAVFKAGLFPEDSLRETRRVFMALYSVDHSRFDLYSTKMARVFSYRATMNALKPTKRGSDSIMQRTDYQLIELILHGKISSLSKKDFQTDPGVEQLILRAERLTDEIVQIERGGRVSACERVLRGKFSLSMQIYSTNMQSDW